MELSYIIREGTVSYDGEFLAVESLVTVINPPSCVTFTVEDTTSVQLKPINVAESNPFLLSIRVTISFDGTLKSNPYRSFAWTHHLDFTKLVFTFWDQNSALCWELTCLIESIQQCLHCKDF